MTFSSIVSADIAAGKPVDVDLMANIKDNDDALYGSLGGQATFNIPNGDMETDSDVSGFPDNWVATTYPGGTAGIETTSPINGAQSMKFAHPGGAGNGGGYADSDYMPCGEGASFRLSWLHSATAATMKNQVIIRWFTAAKVACASPTTTVYDSITNPTSATEFSAICNPVSTARFYKVRLVGGENSVDVTGTALFDAVSVARVRARYASASAAASIVFTDIRDCSKAVLTCSDVTFSSSASAGFQMEASTDNGATWLATSIYYQGASGITDTTGAAIWTILATAKDTNFINGEIALRGFKSGEYLTAFQSIEYYTTTPSFTQLDQFYALASTTEVNALRISVILGTITGEFALIEEM